MEMVHSLAILTAGFLMIMVFADESCVNWRCLLSPPTRDKIKKDDHFNAPFPGNYHLSGFQLSVISNREITLTFFLWVWLYVSHSVEIDTSFPSMSKRWAED